MEADRRALVVEDDAGVADVVCDRLCGCGFDQCAVKVATHAMAAAQALDAETFHLILLDQRLPYSERDLNPRDEVGRNLLRECRRKHPGIPVIVMTAHAGGTAERASDTTVQMMKLGAHDFIMKPFEQSPESFEEKVHAALDAAQAAPPADPQPDQKHHLRFGPGKMVSVDGIEIAGEIVPVLRALRELFLADQAQERLPEAYQTMKGIALALAVGLEDTDDDKIRRRVRIFRQKLATEYRAHHGVELDDQAIIENQKRAGYRLNPRRVAVTA